MQEPLFYSSDDPLYTSRRNLPHWSQENRVQFVTFRLADSLPLSVIMDFREERDTWLKQHPKPWSDEDARTYYQLYEVKFEKWLDNCHGSCILKNPSVRQFLENAFGECDGRKMTIYAYVIMPNHVHLLASPIGDNTIQSVLARVRRISARNINLYSGSKGRVWQSEVFDHLVRSSHYFLKYLRYIIDNPTRLTSDAFSFYLSKEVRDMWGCFLQDDNPVSNGISYAVR